MSCRARLDKLTSAPEDEKPETKKDIILRSALKIAHTASVRLPRRRHVRSKSAVPPELPPPSSTPTRARAQSLQSEKPLGEGWVRIEKTAGGREGGLTAVGEAGAGRVAENGRGVEETNNNDNPSPPPKGKLHRRRNLNVTFDCPQPPPDWERETLPQTPWPTPTTPYLVADGLKLRTVFPEPPRVHHT